MPAILFEGDEPAPGPPASPEPKYVVATPTPPPCSAPVQLPESYGTGRLLLVARAPHSLYLHWDLSADQQQAFSGRQLVIRLHRQTPTGPQTTELRAQPHTRDWFVPADMSGARYIAELGYYTPEHSWQSLAGSQPADTPPEQQAAEKAAVFATFAPPSSKPDELRQTAPKEFPIPPLTAKAGWQPPVSPSSTPAPPGPVLAPGPSQLPSSVQPPNSPFSAQPAEVASTLDVWEWTPAQEQALAEFIAWTWQRQEWPGSAQIAELIQRGIPGISSLQQLQLEQLIPAGISSPRAGPLPGPKPFWFNVNAELVIYGATEPNATVAIGQRVIRLRPDGSFSYRFALPDGQYELALTAVSPTGDTRHATLSFRRITEYQGEVGAHGQDPALKPPGDQNVS